MKFAWALVATIILAGCGSAQPIPSASQLSAADHGPYPASFQLAIKEHTRRTLRDPDSAMYDFFRAPTKTWIGYGPEFTYGWGTCAYVNSKNGFGGYSGNQIGFFFLKHGEVQESVLSDGSGSMETLVRNRCAHLPVPND